MAKAGDGKPRSSKRMRSKTICVRTTPEELTLIERRMRKGGYLTTSAFGRDLMCNGAGVTPRLRADLGALSMRGAKLNHIAAQLARMGADDHADALRQLSREIAMEQRMIFEEESNAGKSNF